MLFRQQDIDAGNGKLGIWKITETARLLQKLYSEHYDEPVPTTITSAKRLSEWLCTRLLVMHLMGEPVTIKYSISGKPCLEDTSFQISISHTDNYVAILIHKNKNVGIDIEKYSDKILRIAPRFIAETEYVDETQAVTHSLLHWSAKETLFKMLPETEIDFKQHLFLQPFTPTKNGTILARESRTENNASFVIHYEVAEDYVLTWSLQ